MKYRASYYAVISAFLIAASIGCSGNYEKKIIGRWGGDIDGMVNDPRYKQKEFKKSSYDLLYKMLTSITIEITSDKVVSQADGRKTETGYRVIEASKDKVIVEAADGSNKGKHITFNIIDNDHISMTEENNPGIFYLKRF